MSLVSCVAFLPGCQWGDPVKTRVPEVSTRFTANPLPTVPDQLIAGSAQVPQTRVGLAMQCGTEPAQMSFAASLGTVLIRELQLSTGGFRVTPLAALELRTAVPALDVNGVPDVVTVSLQEPVDTLPPHLPPSPFYDSATPVLVDQILVARVIEYRPYYPMLATLELRVLDSETQNEMYSTTATWSGDDYSLADECCPPKKTPWFGREPKCQPAPGHNSPIALAHEIAKDVTSWFCMSTSPGMGGIVVAENAASEAPQEVVPNTEGVQEEPPAVAMAPATLGSSTTTTASTEPTKESTEDSSKRGFISRFVSSRKAKSPATSEQSGKSE